MDQATDQSVTIDERVLAPLTTAERYEALDVLRGVAVLGILAMNIMVFAMPLAAYSNPTVYLPYEGVNRIVYPIVHVLFDLKMMGLFSMLFGAGVVVYANKAERGMPIARVRSLWLRRMFWLFVIGMVHAYGVWEGDILVAYALCGVIVLWWLRRLPPVWLLVCAAGFFAVHILLSIGHGVQAWFFLNEATTPADVNMTPEKFEEARVMLKEFFAPTQEQIDQTLSAFRGGWLDVFAARAEMASMFQTSGFIFFIFWRATSMMLLGAALTKWGVLTGLRSNRFYLLLMLIGYGVGLPLVVAGIIYNNSTGFDSRMYPLLGAQFNTVGSLPMALGHVGLIVWLLKSRLLGLLGRALAAAGRMALTNYLMQSVIAGLIFYGYGLGYYGRLDRLEMELVVVGIWVVELLWSVWWLRRFRFGPAEWLWRSLTYMRPQPMRVAHEPI